MSRTFVLVPMLVGLVVSSGCASLNKKERGAIIGGATGAAVGGIVGRANGSTAKGAIIGAAVGGAAGAVIGHPLAQQAKEIPQHIPGAVVARVGAGRQGTFESGLLFDYDSDMLRDAARKNLSTLAASLEKYPNTDLMIVGHTDATGPDAYNMSLSERRAAAASNYLASEGVARTRLRSTGRGESEPVAPNDTEADRQKNRRVEVAIYANEQFKAQALRQQ